MKQPRLRFCFFGPILLLALVGVSAAQDFALDHARVGSSGASGGGEFNLLGSVGQPAPGIMQGRDFSLVTGFRAQVEAAPTSAAPRLGVSLTDGVVTIFWPKPPENWILEETGALVSMPGAGSWVPVSRPYATNAAQVFVTAPAPVGKTFYRLRRQ